MQEYNKSFNFKSCPFCGNSPRYLEVKVGYWTERVICDICKFHLTPKKWEHRAEVNDE